MTRQLSRENHKAAVSEPLYGKIWAGLKHFPNGLAEGSTNPPTVSGPAAAALISAGIGCVTGEGAIASFQPVNQSALNLVQQTPLPNLLPSSASTNTPTPVVDFRVVFTSLGILEVSPWNGFGK